MGELKFMRCGLAKALKGCLFIIAGAFSLSASADLVAFDDQILLENVEPAISESSVNQLLLDQDDFGTLLLSTDSVDTTLPSMAALPGSTSAERSSQADSPLMEAQSNRGGDFLVPIPAIGAGWALLIGVGMYKVGCRVLRVKG